MIKLSKRMEAVAGLVPEGAVVWDVGCDHGYVSIYLVERGICPKVVASDVREGPLRAARENIRQAGLEDKITVVISDGIAADIDVSPPPDTLIIAGMGGPLMISILKNGGSKTASFKNLILQPQSHIWEVRDFLRDKGYVVDREDMVFEEGKYYPMMRAFYEPEPDSEYNREGAVREGLDREGFDREGFDPLYQYYYEDIFGSDTFDDWEYINYKLAVNNYGGLLIKQKHPILKSFLLKEDKTREKIKNSILNSMSYENEENKKRLLEIEQDAYISDFILRRCMQYDM